MADMSPQAAGATLSVRQAAGLLGVSRWTVYGAVARNELQAVRVGKTIRIARAPLMHRLGITNE